MFQRAILYRCVYCTCVIVCMYERASIFLCVRVCVRACVRVCVCACVHLCVREREYFQRAVFLTRRYVTLCVTTHMICVTTHMTRSYSFVNVSHHWSLLTHSFFSFDMGIGLL